MDSEDREHFKMIGSALAEPQTGLPSKSSKEQSNSRLDQAYCLQKAKAICGCYRRDEAQDPETFAAALAVVLGDYPQSVVDYAADPRTGVIRKFPMGLPQVGQIGDYLDSIQAQQTRLKHYQSLPKFKRFEGRPLNREPNLFVPADHRLYEKLCKDHEETGGEWSHFIRGYVCVDKIARDGIMVPLLWFEEPQKKATELIERASKHFFERECQANGIDPAKGISPSLIKTLGGNYDVLDA